MVAWPPPPAARITSTAPPGWHICTAYARLVDAVIIGVATACADDPQLTVRHVFGPNPVRVVIDPHRRLSPNARLLAQGHCQSKFYTARSRTWAGWSSIVFVHESPTHSARFDAENGLLLICLDNASRWDAPHRLHLLQAGDQVCARGEELDYAPLSLAPLDTSGKPP
jgi:riboflavin biosynthesis pyrimidine reductase